MHLISVKEPSTLYFPSAVFSMNKEMKGSGIGTLKSGDACFVCLNRWSLLDESLISIS